MLRITKLLELLIETQKETNKSIKGLREDLEPQLNKITMNGNKISIIDNQLTTIYTKEDTIKAINKECDYRKEYEECKDENYALLELIEKYCKYDNKYKVLDIFEEINSKYLIEKR